MKKTINLIVASVLVVLMIVGSAAPVVGTEYDIVVDGTGVYPDDVVVVQYAVDNYSRILLRGTFNFGEWGTVAVTADNVEIHGEKSGDIYNTKIMGGQGIVVGSSATGPLEFVFNPDALEEVNNFTIENIFFEDPIFGIGVLSCHGNVRIIGNKIVDGRPVDYGGYPLSIGIYVGSVGAAYDPTVVTADVTIANNYIDGRGRSWAKRPKDDPWAVRDSGDRRWYRGVTEGIELSNVNVHANIVGNEVVGTLWSGIKITNGVALSEEMTATVTGNTIIPSPTESYGDPFDAWDVTVRFAHNSVYVANPNSWGVACESCYDSVIENNRISYNGYVGGISLLVDWESNWPVTGNVVRSNTISGAAPFAIALVPALIGGMAPAEDNTFVGNNISGFIPDPTVWGVGAHYVLMEGANNNLIVGDHGDVIDLGEDNIITGLTKVPGNIGQQLSDAMQRKRAMPM